MSGLAEVSARLPGYALARRGAAPLLGLLTLALVAWFVAPHASYVRAYPQDTFGLLDGMHRMALGQSPHRDFSTIIGVLYYGIPAAFVRAGADPLRATGYATAILLLLNYAMLRHLAATRLGGPLFLLFGVWSALALAARLNFGEDPQFVTMAMGYNRYCTVFLCELLLLFIPPRQPTRRVAAIDALAMGVILTLLFYSKVTFGLCGLAAVALLAIYRGREAGAAAAAALLFLAAAVAFEMTFHFHRAMLGDVLMAARASGPGGRITWLGNEVALNLPELLAGLAFPAALLVRDRLLTWRLAALFGFVTAASLLLLNNSAQLRVLSLPFAMLFVTANLLDDAAGGPEERAGGWPRRWPEGRAGGAATRERLARHRQWVRGATLVVGLLYTYPLAANLVVVAIKTFTSPVADLGTALRGELRTEWRGPDALEDVRPAAGVALSAFDILGRGIDASRLNFPDRLGDRMYLATLSDGVAALRQGCGPSPRVLTADFVNPFAAVLDLPVGGGMIFLHDGLLVSARMYVAPRRLFAGIDCVMVPKLPLRPPSLAFFQATYGDYLAAHFRVAARTDYWIVWRASGG